MLYQFAGAAIKRGAQWRDRALGHGHLPRLEILRTLHQLWSMNLQCMLFTFTLLIYPKGYKGQSDADYGGDERQSKTDSVDRISGR